MTGVPAQIQRSRLPLDEDFVDLRKGGWYNRNPLPSFAEKLCEAVEEKEMSESFVTFDELSGNSYVDNLGKDLVKLGMTPGPTRCVARISDNDPRLGKGERFQITLVAEEIIERVNREHGLDLGLKEHNGNLLLFCGLGKNPRDEQIFQIPVTLASHLDEITYMVKNERDEAGDQLLLPLCNAPDCIKDKNNIVKILGFRGEHHRRLAEVGTGTIKVQEIKRKKQTRKFGFLKSEAKDIFPGDLVIQGYCHEKMDASYTLGSVIHMKGLDDRVGCIAHIYTLVELAKRGLSAKAILAGDEEGFNKDVSWARLIRPSFRDYCRRDGVIIICDGFDGYWLDDEFKGREEPLSEALITAYVSHGSGGGDPGIFSLLRDKVVPVAQECGFEVEVVTSYASRSIDPKIMDEFPLIGFINWSNGQVGGDDAICHLDESVLLRQIVNIIGATCITLGILSKVL
jgi:hypothetical protein